MIFTASLPQIKSFLRPANLTAATVALLVRLITAFCQHPGRMSADTAAKAVRSQTRHRAQLARFLARSHWSKDWSLLQDVAGLLLLQEARSLLGCGVRRPIDPPLIVRTEIFDHHWTLQKKLRGCLIFPHICFVI